MRVAFVSLMGDAPWGGSEVLWSQTAAHALANGHEVFISAYDWPETPPALLGLEKQGAKLFLRPRYNPSLKVRLMNRMKGTGNRNTAEIRALRKFAPDLIVVNQGGAHDVFYRKDLLALLQQGQLPYCLVCHLYHDPIRLSEEQRAVLTQLFTQARLVLAISQNQADVIQRQLATRLPQCVVVQNPINVPAAWPIPFPAQEVAQFAVVASLDVDRKGQDVLFAALSGSEWQRRRWILNLYGQGPDLEYLKRLARYYGIADRVRFCGYVQQSADIWMVNHALIISSRIESGPMVLAEAMLSGRMVVSTDVGMVQDWVQEGINGFIAEASLPHSLAAALERCWQRQADWDTLGTVANETAVGRISFSPEKRMLTLLLEAGRAVRAGAEAPKAFVKDNNAPLTAMTVY